MRSGRFAEKLDSESVHAYIVVLQQCTHSRMDSANTILTPFAWRRNLSLSPARPFTIALLWSYLLLRVAVLPAAGDFWTVQAAIKGVQSTKTSSLVTLKVCWIPQKHLGSSNSTRLSVSLSILGSEQPAPCDCQRPVASQPRVHQPAEAVTATANRAPPLS